MRRERFGFNANHHIIAWIAPDTRPRAVVIFEILDSKAGGWGPGGGHSLFESQ